MDSERKKPSADLRKYYTIFLESGLILVLVIFLVATKMNLSSEEEDVELTEEQEVVEMEEIIQTEQQEEPPPPPRPPTPEEVPDDEVIEDSDIDVDAEFDMDEPLEEPPPPGDEEEEEEEFFTVVEDMPELIGGIGELQQHIEYPEQARQAGIEGQVVIQFIVNEDGQVENAEVVRGIGGGADEEALRVVEQEAEFEPGKQRGEPVPVQFSLPITFRLQ